MINNANLIRALYWLLAGLRAIKNDMGPQLDEAMSNIWQLADIQEETENV